MMLTAEQLAACTGARIDRAQACLAGLVDAMRIFDISTPDRARMFLANIGHETGGLKYLSEIWGPTAEQKRYERDFRAPWPMGNEQARLPAFAANRLAYSLGNLHTGDGRRFAGHGMLQTTGRYNHAKVRDRLRARLPHLTVPDFEVEPHKLAEPQWAALSAGDYCEMKNCNAMADAGDFDGYCDLVNKGRKTEDEGDTNGWEDRLALHVASQAVLA